MQIHRGSRFRHRLRFRFSDEGLSLGVCSVVAVGQRVSLRVGEDSSVALDLESAALVGLFLGFGVGEGVD